MSYDWTKIQTMQAELEEFSDHEHPSSIDEMLKGLCFLVGYPDYISETLLDVLVAEMEGRLKNYKENTRIETTEETFTRNVTELVWINEEAESYDPNTNH